MFSRRRGPRSVAGIDRCDDPACQTCRRTHLDKRPEACYRPKTRRTGPREKKRILMGRNFENRKNAIFKTAAQKSKLYSKYGRLLYVAAKNGVADPDANPALRSMIEKAKKDQVPAHVIEKAMQKARGVGGEDFLSARYEGFGPGGSLVIVDCLTDNYQ